MFTTTVRDQFFYDSCWWYIIWLEGSTWPN